MGQSLAFARMFYLFNSYSFTFHYVFSKAQDKDLTLHVCAGCISLLKKSLDISLKPETSLLAFQND